MKALYVFTCTHGKHCNFISDCNECGKAEINRLRQIIKLSKNRIERMEILLIDEPKNTLAKEVHSLYNDLEQWTNP